MSADHPAVDRVRSVLTYVRTHKAAVTAATVAVVGLAAHYFPSLPADDLLRAVYALLSAV